MYPPIYNLLNVASSSSLGVSSVFFSSRDTLILYTFVEPSSAVTITSTLLFPTWRLFPPLISTFALVSLASALTVTLVWSFGTVKLYSVVSLLKAGEIL